MNDEESVIADLKSYLNASFDTSNIKTSDVNRNNMNRNNIKAPYNAPCNAPYSGLFSNVPGPRSLELSSFGVEGVSLLEAKHHSMNRQIDILKVQNANLVEQLNEVSCLYDGMCDKYNSVSSHLAVSEKSFVEERDEIMRVTGIEMSKKVREIERLKRDVMVVKGNATAARIDRVRRDARRDVEEDWGVRYEALEKKYDKLHDKCRAITKENDRLKKEIVAVEESSGVKAENEVRELLQNMRMSMEEYNRKERIKIRDTIRYMKDNTVPIEVHKRQICEIKNDMDRFRDGLIDLYAEKLKVGGLASELKWKLLAGIEKETSGSVGSAVERSVVQGVVGQSFEQSGKKSGGESAEESFQQGDEQGVERGVRDGGEGQSVGGCGGGGEGGGGE
jgi:hypothetical protein